MKACLRKGPLVHRKDRVFETLRSLSHQRPTQRSTLRRYGGFTAEEVAELAGVDRTNASRDLNLLAQEGLIERIPGKPTVGIEVPNTKRDVISLRQRNWTNRAGQIKVRRMFSIWTNGSGFCLMALCSYI